MINIYDNFNQKVRKPLENNHVCNKLNDIKLPYDGLITFQKSDRKFYKYLNGEFKETLTNGLIINIEDFGGVGDGVTDDTQAIQNAINSLGVTGGTVWLSRNKKYLINGSLTIKENTTLRGDFIVAGDPQKDFLDGCIYNQLGSALILNPLNTITLNSNASITNCIMYPKNCVFPSPNSSGFAGTALTINGSDVNIMEVMILGFNKAIYSNGNDRMRIAWVYGDNQNGIEITNCYDIPRLNNIHFWPFLTTPLQYTSDNLPIHHRTGKAFYIHDNVDGAKLTDCFSYGYTIGFDFANVSTTKLMSCMADNTKQLTDSIAFRFQTYCPKTTLIGCDAWSCEHGYLINLSDNSVRLVGCTANSNTYDGVFGNGTGTIYVDSCDLMDSQCGVNIASATIRVFVENCRFENLTVKDINTVASSNVFVRNNDFFNRANGYYPVAGITPNTIASGAILSLPSNGDFFLVSGTTTIDNIDGGWCGRRVTLKFVSADCSVTDSNIRLAGEYISTSESTLSLIHDGSYWTETARSLN